MYNTIKNHFATKQIYDVNTLECFYYLLYLLIHKYNRFAVDCIFYILEYFKSNDDDDVALKTHNLLLQYCWLRRKVFYGRRQIFEHMFPMYEDNHCHISKILGCVS